MADKSNLHAIPSTTSVLKGAMDHLKRTMPQQAVIAKVMMDEYVNAGFTEDQALKMVSYAIFR